MSGDSAKAERFLRRLDPLQGALEAYCRKMLHDPAAVEDVLQEAVADALRDFHFHIEGANYRTWIFRYLNLEILEYNRKHAKLRAQEGLPEELSAQSGELSAGDRVLEAILEAPDAVLDQCDEAITHAVRMLSELLRAIGEFKYAEIAEVLEIPVGTVMSCLSRVRIRLREQLSDYCRRQGLLPGDF